jgi:hypothetical protein
VLLNDFACTNTMLFVCYDLNFVWWLWTWWSLPCCM